MKRWISVFLVMLMALSLAACSNGVSQEKRDEESAKREGAHPNNSEMVQEPLTEPIQSDDDWFVAPEEPMNEIDGVDMEITNALTSQGYTIEHASQIQEILNRVGISTVSVESMTGEPENGLNSVVSYPNGYTDRDRRFFFTTEDGVLFYAGFSDEDLYDSALGGYLKSYEDVHVPEKEVSTETYNALRTLAEAEVKKYLNQPESADFGMLDWGIGRSDSKYQVIGRVEAKNAFNAQKEMPFSVWFEVEGSTYVVEGIALDGIRVK